MRRFFRNHLPDHDTIRRHRWLSPVQHWLHHPNLWHLHRRSVAGGVAIGLFCGLIPGPLQMLAAVLLAVAFRVNLPVAAFTTLYTNPITLVPLYMFAYEIGIRVSGASNGSAIPAFPEVHWQDWFGEVWVWLMALGQPLLIGLPLLALGLATIGYISVRLAWRLMVVWKWRRRQVR
ncbi:MAG: DUF2062 domain-containing protein [Nitrosomonadales bacterium]|nr:DUF2062 domain-containing protein [Nitrosomonadales bacterium]